MLYEFQILISSIQYFVSVMFCFLKNSRICMYDVLGSKAAILIASESSL